ncbi:MAG: SAM-dependent chlorinase/fluorinase [Gammaproteobacteria bacterium SHHR-1]
MKVPRVLRGIGLFTDFGAEDPYQGAIKAVLLSAAPGLPLYDLMSAAPRFDPRASAYLLAALLETLPPGQLLICVIDPGVGSNRMALRVKTAEHLLIGPDNGLFAPLIQRQNAQVEEIGWRPAQLSASFHGRDLFAPAALRHLAGQDLALRPLAAGQWQGADWPEDLLEVIHVDSYGNLITGQRAVEGSEDRLLELGGRQIAAARTFSERPPGGLFWYANSFGLVEIAANQASAAEQLQADRGTACRWLGP